MTVALQLQQVVADAGGFLGVRGQLDEVPELNAGRGIFKRRVAIVSTLNTTIMEIPLFGRIKVKKFKTEQGLRGYEFDSIIIDEVSDHLHITSTPKGKNYLYDLLKVRVKK